MSLATNYERLRDVMETAISTRQIFPRQEIEEALRDFDLDVRHEHELREAILREHYASHVDSPRFCSSEVCKKAAGEW